MFIVRHLTHEVAVLETKALVTSCLDYYNSLLRHLSTCISPSVFRTLLRVKNSNGCLWSVVVFEIITLIYSFLHWGALSSFAFSWSLSSCSYNTRYGLHDQQFLQFQIFTLQVTNQSNILAKIFAFDAP